MNINSDAAIIAIDRVIAEWQNKIDILKQSRQILNDNNMIGNNGSLLGEGGSKEKVAPVLNNPASRILAIMKAENRFLFRTEIEDIAKKQGKPFNGRISGIISSIKKKDKDGLCLYVIDNAHKVWGFNHYLDKNGEIKSEHMYKGTE